MRAENICNGIKDNETYTCDCDKHYAYTCVECIEKEIQEAQWDIIQYYSRIIKEELKLNPLPKSKEEAQKLEKIMLIPLYDQVLIRKFAAPDKTPSGLIIPQSVREEQMAEGEVVAVGFGKLLQDGRYAPMPVTVGAKVVWPQFAGNKVKVGDEELVIVRAEEIVGRVTPELPG